MKKLFKNPVVAYGIFWFWNLILIILLAWGQFEENIISEIFRHFFVEDAPWSHFLFMSLLVLIPIVSIYLVGKYFLKKPAMILKLFYGIEIPLAFLCFIRLFVFREMNPGTTHFFILFILGILSLLFELFKGLDLKSKSYSFLQMIGHTFLFLM